MRDDGPDNYIAAIVTVIVGPILIMAMVGSLGFFLVDLFYDGRYAGRLYWIMGWFTLAIVLIGRISMTEGFDKASMYGVLLSGAMCLAIWRFVDGAAFPCMAVLFVMWWFAHKLTWDCTVDDLSKDMTGKGLLETAGLASEGKPERDSQVAAKTARAKTEGGKNAPEGVTATDQPTPGFWRRMLLRDKRFHAPGVWILYFSLAALPLYGLGQLMLPAGDEARRYRAFQFLAIYTAAGLGLLMTTSFLSLRRYLYKRKVRMPMGVAASWVVGGPVIILLILGLALLLPRPGVNDSFSRSPLAVSITSPERSESRVQTGDDGADKNREGETSQAQGKTPREDETPSDDDDPKRSGKAPGEDERQETSQGGRQDEGGHGSRDGEKGGESKEGSQSNERGDGEKRNGESGDKNDGGKKEDGGEQESADKSGEKTDGERDSDDAGQQQDDGKQEERESSNGARRRGDDQGEKQQEERDESSEAAPSQQQEQDSSWRMPEVSLSLQGGWLMAIFKIVLYVVIGLAIVYFAWKHRAAIKEALADLARIIREFLDRLFGGRKATAASDDDEELGPSGPIHPPFSSYRDPFSTGAASRMAPDAVIRYTFEALEAWARDHGCPRRTDRTPYEFTAAIGDVFPEMEDELRRLAGLYVHAAYSPATLTAKHVEKLRGVWHAMDRLKPSPRPIPAPADVG